MKRNTFDIFEPPPGAMTLAVKRTRHLPDGALAIHAIHEQDFLDTLAGSAYLAGVADAATVFGHRTEGTYEEER